MQRFDLIDVAALAPPNGSGGGLAELFIKYMIYNDKFSFSTSSSVTWKQMPPQIVQDWHASQAGDDAATNAKDAVNDQSRAKIKPHRDCQCGAENGRE